MDFTGITNENEFYSNHYLTAILEKDLKGVLKKWKLRETEEKLRSPHAGLKGISREYFKTRDRETRARRPGDKLDLQRRFLQQFLEILGFDVAIGLEESEDGAAIPVMGTVARRSGAPELWIIEAFDPSSEGIDPLKTDHRSPAGVRPAPARGPVEIHG